MVGLSRLVEIVSNPLIWKGLHCGETVPKVNRSVNNAAGADSCGPFLIHC